MIPITGPFCYYPYFCEGCTHRCEKDSICQFEPAMPNIEEIRKEFGLENAERRVRNDRQRSN